MEIRPPRLVRAYGAIFTVLWCGGVAAFAFAAARRHSPAVVIGVLMFIAGAALGYRLFRLGVTADGDALTVRNNTRTRVLARRDIEGFRIGSPGTGRLPTSRAVLVLLRDDTVLTLDVTAALPLGNRGRRRVEEQLEQLRRWLGGQG